MIEKLHNNLRDTSTSLSVRPEHSRGTKPVERVEKRKESMARFSFSRDTFEKKKKRIKEELDKASRLWKEVSKKFKWSQTLP